MTARETNEWTPGALGTPNELQLLGGPIARCLQEIDDGRKNYQRRLFMLSTILVTGWDSKQNDLLDEWRTAVDDRPMI